MKAQKIPKLIREELPATITLPKFIDKFIAIFNSLIDQQNNNLINNVDMVNNFAGQWVVLNDVLGSDLANLRIKWERKDIPLEMRLSQINEVNKNGIATLTNSGSIGVISQFPSATNIPIGYFECDGRALKRADYPELFAIIGTTYNNQTNPTTGSLWGSPASDEFRIPDTRGIFLRHAGTSVRMVGSVGTLSVVTSVGMVSDDSTARNGLGGAPTTSASTNTGNNSVGHTHGVSITSGTESADHSHSGTTASGGAHQHQTGMSHNNNPFGFGPNAANQGSASANITYPRNLTESNGAHTHTFTTGGRSVAHTHAVIGNTGGISANHTHAFSVTMTPLLSVGDTETRVRNRGVLNIIQVSRISSSSIPQISPNWNYDGTNIIGSVLNVDTTKKYNARIWVQS